MSRKSKITKYMLRRFFQHQNYLLVCKFSVTQAKSKTLSHLFKSFINSMAIFIYIVLVCDGIFKPQFWGTRQFLPVFHPIQVLERIWTVRQVCVHGAIWLHQERYRLKRWEIVVWSVKWTNATN